MKHWVLMFLTLCFASCAIEALDMADDLSTDDVDVADEELQFGCLADLSAKQYFQWYFNVEDGELHWFSDGGSTNWRHCSCTLGKLPT